MPMRPIKFPGEYKRPVILITFALLLFFVIYRLDSLAHFCGIAIGILLPFIFGAFLAFILDIPMRRFEGFFARRLPGIKAGAARAISFFLVIILIALVLGAVTVMLVSDLNRAYADLIEKIPALYGEFIRWVNTLDLTWLEEYFNTRENVDAQTVRSQVSSFLRFVGQGISASSGAISTFASGLWNAMMCLLSTVYFLFDKRRLLSQFRRLVRAYLPPRWADACRELSGLTRETFENFIVGQCRMAPIFGAMIGVFMFAARMPYAALVGVLSTVLALIPMIGATISMIIGALLVLLESPVQAFWFCVAYLVLQQIEGNVIYPHVVGASIGLPPVWMLLAVSVGGSLMGVMGMLLFVPVFAVAYACVKKGVLRREALQKNAKT